MTSLYHSDVSENRSVSSAYDAWAATYDEDVNRTRDLDATVLRDSALSVEHARVIEIGCGTGKNTEWLAQRARSVIALDFSPGMLARARERVTAAQVTFVEHDITLPWPLPDESGDVIVGNLVLEHVADVGRVFREAARVLRLGGELFICELHPYRQRRGGQAHFTSAEGDVVHVPAHVHTMSEYLNAAVSAGLRLRHVGEWLESDAVANALPRLVSFRFSRE